jgi:hypothetical protein
LLAKTWSKTQTSSLRSRLVHFSFSIRAQHFQQPQPLTICLFHGSGFPYVSTGDFKASSITRKARFTFTLPPEYVSDGAVFIRFRAGMVTTVAGTSCTIDAEAFKASTTAGATVSGSDLITTTATTINSLTWSNIDFSVTQTGLVAGDELDVLVTIAGVDAATATAVIAGFRAFVGCTIRG